MSSARRRRIAKMIDAITHSPITTAMPVNAKAGGGFVDFVPATTGTCSDWSTSDTVNAAGRVGNAYAWSVDAIATSMRWSASIGRTIPGSATVTSAGNWAIRTGDTSDAG